jgi:hypothetical protein
MFRFNHHHQGAYYLSLLKLYLLKYAYAATPPKKPQRCILTDYFNSYNFSKLK